MLQVDRHTALVEMAYSVRKCNRFELESRFGDKGPRRTELGDKAVVGLAGL